ncbi:MAG: ABC transporter permease subunit [Candidatus Limnocylindrales bacterium]
MGVLLAYGGWLRNSLAIILVAYVAKFWALGYRQLAGSVDRLPADQVRAARASGAAPFDALRSVIVPFMRPSLVAAWLIVFVFALHELTMSSLLYGPNSATLAVVVLNVQQLGDPTVTAALALLLTGIVALAAAPWPSSGRCWPQLGRTGAAVVATARSWRHDVHRRSGGQLPKRDGRLRPCQSGHPGARPAGGSRRDGGSPGSVGIGQDDDPVRHRGLPSGAVRRDRGRWSTRRRAGSP